MGAPDEKQRIYKVRPKSKKKKKNKEQLQHYSTEMSTRRVHGFHNIHRLNTRNTVVFSFGRYRAAFKDTQPMICRALRTDEAGGLSLDQCANTFKSIASESRPFWWRRSHRIFSSDRVRPADLVPALKRAPNGQFWNRAITSTKAWKWDLEHPTKFQLEQKGERRNWKGI